MTACFADTRIAGQWSFAGNPFEDLDESRIAPEIAKTSERVGGACYDRTFLF
jgi:hypothetical protein